MCWEKSFGFALRKIMRTHSFNRRRASRANKREHVVSKPIIRSELTERSFIYPEHVRLSIACGCTAVQASIFIARGEAAELNTHTLCVHGLSWCGRMYELRFKIRTSRNKEWVGALLFSIDSANAMVLLSCWGTCAPMNFGVCGLRDYEKCYRICFTFPRANVDITSMFSPITSTSSCSASWIFILTHSRFIQLFDRSLL